jgi:hypothetical protein
MIENIVIMFAAAVFIAGGFSFYSWFKSRISETLWEKDFERFQNSLYQKHKEDMDKCFDMINTLTRRQPKEWVLEDFERLVDEHPDKFHIEFIMTDGTKVMMDRKGFAVRGDAERRRDPYVD